MILMSNLNKSLFGSAKGQKNPQNSHFLYSTITRYIAWILNGELTRKGNHPFNEGNIS